MKKLYVFLLFLACFLLPGCDLFEFNNNGEEEIPSGLSFYTSVPGLSIFFVDGEGDDLIDLESRETWPLATPNPLGSHSLEEYTGAATQYSIGSETCWSYCNDSNILWFDKETNLVGFRSFLWGKTVEPEFTTWVYQGSALDSIKVGFTYVTAAESEIQGGSWSVKVHSIKYNGIEILNGNENGKVFVQRPSPESTVVKVGRL